MACVAAHLHLDVRGEVYLGIRGEGNSRLRRDGAATVSRYRRVPVVEVAGVVKDVDETANELFELNDTASQLRVLALKLSGVQARRDNGYGVGMGGPGRGGVRDDGGGRTRCRLTSRGLEEVLKLGDALLEGRLMVLFCVTRALCGLAVTKDTGTSSRLGHGDPRLIHITRASTETNLLTPVVSGRPGGPSTRLRPGGRRGRGGRGAEVVVVVDFRFAVVGVRGDRLLGGCLAFLGGRRRHTRELE